LGVCPFDVDVGGNNYRSGGDKMSEKHVHKYTKKVTEKSRLLNGAMDRLLQHMCVIEVGGKPCGARKTYDVERVHD
jgi:hypothetical protein